MLFNNILFGFLAVWTVAAEPAPAPAPTPEPTAPPADLREVVKRQSIQQPADVQGQMSSVQSVFQQVYGISSIPSDPQVLMSLANVLNAYARSQANEPSVRDFASSLSTAVPSSVLESIKISGIAPFTATAAPQWFSQLDQPLQNQILNQETQARSLVTSALGITNAGPGQIALATGGNNGAQNGNGQNTGQGLGPDPSAEQGQGTQATPNWAPRATAEAALGVLAAVGVGAIALL